MGSTRKLRFDLERTLRTLGRWLLAHRVQMPPEFSTMFSPIKDDGPMRPEERSCLFWLAVSHLNRHTLAERRPDDPLPCPDHDGRCRVLGVAQAILLGCDALRDRKEIPHVTQLREAFKDAHREFQKLFDALGDYLQNCKLLHEGKWKDLPETAQTGDSKSPIHDHQSVCEIPEELREQVRDLDRFMRHTDAVSLQSQYSSRPLAHSFSLRARPKALLLAEMQAALVEEGWRYEDVAEVIDDGESPEPEKVIERIRKRIKSRFKSPKKVPAKEDATKPQTRRLTSPTPPSRRRPRQPPILILRPTWGRNCVDQRRQPES